VTHTSKLSFSRVSDFGRFKVLTAVNMKIAVFWHVTPCTLVDIYHVSIYGITSQKNVIFIADFDNHCLVNGSSL
jgi:hypothetical protein